MATNQFKRAAQIKKAWAIIDALDRLFRSSLGFDPFAQGFAIAHHLATWDAEKWASISVIAGANPPSDETKAIILDRYRSRGEQHQRGQRRSA